MEIHIMKKMILFPLLVLLLSGCTAVQQTENTPEWISLFDGETLNGWKSSEFGYKSFTVKDGAIVANGKDYSHLFYAGKVNGAVFKNFEFKAEVMTHPNSNGGIYFHTQFQPKGWPALGFECQVNNTYEKDPKKTGSLYGVQNVSVAPAKDNEWFDYHILVQENHIIVKVNGETTADWVQPVDWEGIHAANPDIPTAAAVGKLASGTFALQAHDPNSVVLYKNIRVRPLP